MDPITAGIGAAIGAGSKLLGGFMDQNERENDREMQKYIAEKNMELQKQFAQEGIRWKVADAQSAGIHPLYALGAQTTSFSPVSIGSSQSSNWSDTLGGMGQDISRAINATRTTDERDEAFQTSARALELEGKKLDNDIKRATLASSVQRISQQGNPPMPGGVVPQADKFEERPMLRMPGGPWETSKHWTNAEDFEKRYGELTDWVFGPQILWADYKQNYGAPEWMPTFRPGSWLHRTFGDSFDSRFGKWNRR